MHRHVACLALIAAGLIVRTAPAEDWARFRGPNGSGMAADAFSKPIREADLDWKVDLPGIGHSSPAVRTDPAVGDRVYLTCGDGKTAERTILCLCGKDGHVLWRVSYPSHPYPQHRENNFASSSPAVDELGVYVSFTTPGEYTVVALGHDGKERWRQTLGAFTSQWGSGASPIVVGEMLIVSNDQEGPQSSIIALDRQSGKKVWVAQRKSSDKTSSATPCLYTPPGGKPQLLVTSKASGITAIDVRTGEAVWQLGDALNARTIGSPLVIGDEELLATCGEGSSNRQLVAIHAPAAGPAATLFKLTKIPPYVPTALVKGKLLFLWSDNGTLSCVAAATGDTIWTEKLGGEFYGSPVCCGDTLWAMSNRGELIGVRATDHFELVSRLDLGDTTHATPAVANGRMYLRTASHLACVSAK